MKKFKSLPFNIQDLESYLGDLYETTDLEIIQIQELSPDTLQKGDRIKEFGYGKPILINLRIADMNDQIVLHTVRKDKYGHERRADRASNILLDYDTFNDLPQHITCLDIGAFTNTGSLMSIADANEFFLITQYIPGNLYVNDLSRLMKNENLLPEDQNRAVRLAQYLADIHSVKRQDSVVYNRTIRDLLGHGEGIMGMTDSYPHNDTVFSPKKLLAIEKRLIDWRWSFKSNGHRLSQVHGDFHPWNVIFTNDEEFYTLDRSRGSWGEPADDVTAMTINYLFFSLQRYGELIGPFKILFDSFWDHYLSQTKDLEIHKYVQPFYAWRGLVLAHPNWYPNINESVRSSLLNFIQNILNTEWFVQENISDYLLGVS